MIFIFLDGVGMGKTDANNPFFTAQTSYLPFYGEENILPDGTPIKGIDACLGVEGIPQSATGQTTIYTGENIPARLKEHKGSYPNKKMRQVIMSQNLLKRLNVNSIKARFINAYPQHSELFSKHVSLEEDGSYNFTEKFPRLFQRRISVTSCMLIANGMTPFDVGEIREKRSIFQDYTNRYLIERGLDIPEYSPETAAEILFNASREFEFVLYEYFQTDIYAHRKSLEESLELIRGLDRLVGKLLTLLDPRDDTLLITSDHGNLEDFSQRAHTRNPVPLLTWGHRSESLRHRINNLAHITPAIEKYFFPNQSSPKKNQG